MNALRNLFKSGPSGFIKNKRIFRAYEANAYKEMISMLSGLNAQQFINITQEDMTLIHHAAFDGDVEAIGMMSSLPYFKEIIDNDTNEEGWTPLLWAAQQSDTTMVKYLVENGASLLKPKKDGLTVLHVAACQNDIQTLDFAIKTKQTKSIDIGNEEGWTPAHFASFLGNFDALNLLIENGADLSKKHSKNLTCYDEIVRQDNIDLLGCIYSYSKTMKRDMKTPGSFGMTHIAAGSEGTQCLKYLVEQGEFVNQICNEHDQATPLHFAIIVNNYDNAKLLLRHRANPNARDNTGNTPLHYACAGNNLSIVRMLDEYNADATIKNVVGVSSIDVAITEDLKDIKLHFMSQQKYKNYDFSGFAGAK
eukprot:403340270